MDDFTELLNQLKSCRKRTGKIWLTRHLNRKKLTPKQSIKAKCYDCNGFGELDDCDIETCPLYQHSPYVKIKKKSSGTRKTIPRRR